MEASIESTRLQLTRERPRVMVMADGRARTMVVSTAAQNPNKPRIISEVKKSCLPKMKVGFTTSLQDFGKPKISGQLIWNVSQANWHLRTAEVRNGSLFVFKNGSSGIEFRLPLRQLSLQPCGAPRTFCLTRGQDVPLVTFQALTDEEYEKWVKVIAVELIRQTPLQDVRFLDIISITRKRESEGTNLRRGRSEECLMLMDEGLWDSHLSQEDSTDFSRGRRYRSLTLDSTPCDQQSERRHKVLRNKYNFKDDIKKRVKSERICEDAVDGPVEREHSNPGKVKLWRAVKVRPSLPTREEWATETVLRWSRTQSAENIKNLMEKETRLKQEKIVSDESGISSGDENNNTIIEGDGKNSGGETENFSFVSVREKKKFFESLSSDAECGSSPTENAIIMRSNSIGDLKKSSEEYTKLRRRKRTKSLHDLSRTPVPVREICRLFEPRIQDREDGAIEEEEPEGNGTEETSSDKSNSTERNQILAMNQRRLQRGERRLARLRMQITEVEETIKVIADDLKCIASNTLKRREGAEVYAALQRRMAEENSRLERLQEETSRVIKDNQRTIAKLKKCEEN